jgi:hypothetical protein
MEVIQKTATWKYNNDVEYKAKAQGWRRESRQRALDKDPQIYQRGNTEYVRNRYANDAEFRVKRKAAALLRYYIKNGCCKFVLKPLIFLFKLISNCN